MKCDYSTIGNIDAVNEEKADALLAGVGDPSAWAAYTEKALARKIRRDQANAEVVNDAGLPNEVYEYLLLVHIRQLISTPTLTSRERFSLILSNAGWSRSQAARYLRLTPIRYYKTLISARRKAALYKKNRDPYAGWYEVYLVEVNRR